MNSCIPFYQALDVKNSGRGGCSASCSERAALDSQEKCTVMVWLSTLCSPPTSTTHVKLAPSSSVTFSLSTLSATP